MSVTTNQIVDWAVAGVLVSAVGGLAITGFVTLATHPNLTATQKTIGGLVLTFALLGFAMRYIKGAKLKGR